MKKKEEENQKHMKRGCFQAFFIIPTDYSTMRSP